MERRAFLAGVGAVGLGATAATAGYLAVTHESHPYELRVIPAERDWTDVRCELDPTTVKEHPHLETALEAAATEPVGSEVTRGLAPDAAEDLRRALEACDPSTTGNGLYQWEGQWYLAGIIIVDPGLIRDHHNGSGDSHRTHAHPTGG